MKVAFRVDASIWIGSGHLVRCLNLARYLRSEFLANVMFICKKNPGDLIDLLLQEGFEVRILDSLAGDVSVNDQESARSPFCSGTDASRTREVLLAEHFDLLVVDHYQIDITWEVEVSTAVNKVMVIDDIPGRAHSCDLFLDQNLDSSTAEYKLCPQRNVVGLFGPSYALISPHFQKTRRLIDRKFDAIRRCLVYFGSGSDAAKFARAALLALSDSAFSHISVDVVVSEEHGCNELMDLVRSHPKANLWPRQHSLADLMMISDLAIGGGGVSTWERCCLGLPAIAVACSENQKKVVRAVAKRDAAIGLMNFDNLAQRISDELFILIKHPDRMHALSANAFDVCDGEGVRRVSEKIASTIFDDGN